MSNAIEIRIAGGDKNEPTLLIEVSGRIDQAAARQLAQCIEDRIGNHCARVVVDLTAVTEMVSAGIRVLLDLGCQMPSFHDVALVCGNVAIRDLLAFTGLTRLLPIYPDRESCQREWDAD